MEGFFLELYEICDVVISFFYNVMNLTYAEFTDFIQGEFVLRFDTIINSLHCAITIPNIAIIDVIFDTIASLISTLFYPLPIFWDSGQLPNVPFYICFISFFVNGLILVGLIKLVSFIIELIPFE